MWSPSSQTLRSWVQLGAQGCSVSLECMEGGGRDSSVNLGCVCVCDAGKAQKWPQSPQFQSSIFHTSHAEDILSVLLLILFQIYKMVLHLLESFFFSFLFRLWINRVFIHHCVRLHPCGKGYGGTEAGGGTGQEVFAKACGLLHIFFFFLLQLPLVGGL